MDLEETCRKILNETFDDSCYEENTELLNEVRFLRGSSALVLASRSKRYGDTAVRHAKSGQSHLKRINKNDTTDEKIEHIADALDEMFDCQINIRNQIGNLVGVALASVLISERSDKELKKINKSSGRRR